MAAERTPAPMDGGPRVSNPRCTRRRLLQALAAAPLVMAGPGVRSAGVAPVPLGAPQPITRLHTPAPGELLAVSSSGVLWQYTAQAWKERAKGLDPDTPLAAGHGRIAGRSARGALWVLEDGRATLSPAAPLSKHAGIHILALGIIAVAADGRDRGYAVRLDRNATGTWLETARSTEPVLPDARPVQVDLDTAGRADEGHIAVLAGPDSTRYQHGVLGDAIEATRLLYLEWHGLAVRRSLELPAPYVFEDIVPRPVTLPGGPGIAVIRSGPQGGGVVIAGVDSSRADRLRIVAAGPSLGTAHRWMAPTTDGQHLLAVHTPHIGGRLHEYQIDGDRLRARSLVGGVTNHVLGTRELDLAAWIGTLLVVPAQDRRHLRVFDAAADWMERAPIALPAPVAATRTLRLDGLDGCAILLDDGTVWWSRVAG